MTTDPMEILAEELKPLGGMEPLMLAARFKGSGSVSQAYRDLFAARIKQARMFRRFRRDDNRFAALERKAAASLGTIRGSGGA